MKVLVTGANGFLGSWLTRRLQNEGHDVSILVRKTSDLSDLDFFKGQKLYGDVTDENSLTEAFKGQEAIFHLAGLVAYRRADRDKMEKINVQGTQNVVNAIEKTGVPFLLHLSSVVAVGSSYAPNQVLNENSPFNIHDLNLGYFETKLAAEKIVQQACKSEKFKAVIVNPSTIYGPADGKKDSRKMQLKVARGKFPFYSDGGVNVISVHDVIEGILAGWQKGRNGERYILSNENWTIQQLFQEISKYAGVKPPSIHMPTWFLKAVGAAGEVSLKMGGNPSLTLESVRTATMYHWFDNSKAKTELGLKPKPSTLAIEESIRWLKDNGYLNQ